MSIINDYNQKKSSNGITNENSLYQTEFFIPENFKRETLVVTITAENNDSESSRVLQIFSLGQQSDDGKSSTPQIAQKTKCVRKFNSSLIHGPSLGIGAGIASIVIIIIFLGFQGSQPELTIEPAPEIQESGSPKITMNTFLANGSPILGNPNAPVTLVEFGDYQCHFCNVFFHSTEDKILENYVETGKVRMIFKDYNIIGPDSVTASHGAHCADDQKLFWEYHDILYSNWTGENNGWASSENLVKFAQEVGLDLDEWSECMNNQKHSQIILASNEDARSLELTGTPAFFVIGPDGKTTRIFGAQPFEVFENIFETELEKTR